MEKENDIRWIQRFNNYKKALSQLTKFVVKGTKLNELEEQGLIQSFEYTYELAWNTIKDFYENQAETNIQGSKDAFQLAFQRGLINNGDLWMQMLKDRNKTTHSYNEILAKEIANSIINIYYNLFVFLKESLEKQTNNN